jgi:hypothetical protein
MKQLYLEIVPHPREFGPLMFLFLQERIPAAKVELFDDCVHRYFQQANGGFDTRRRQGRYLVIQFNERRVFFENLVIGLNEVRFDISKVIRLHLSAHKSREIFAVDNDRNGEIYQPAVTSVNTERPVANRFEPGVGVRLAALVIVDAVLS